MTHPVKALKKLIEVALPLDTINEAAIAEKQPFTRRHPRSLHIWWARRPLVAARAVIFGQMVNDPSWKWEMEHGTEIPPPAHLKASWAASRKRLFGILEQLVQWGNTTNEAVLEKARAEIRKSWRETCELNKDHPQAADLFNPDKLPALHDPFAGGGSIPLEAQRLGLEAYASDLNPVAVLINKAMIDIPPKFSGCPPVNPDWQRLSPEEKAMREWRGAQGLAEDIRYYGQSMRDEAQKRIGHLYPPVEVTTEMTKGRPDLKPLVGKKLTVIAWLWARTVKSPNPAFRHAEVPLASTFVLSNKEGREAYVQPVVEGDRYHFTVRMGKSPAEAKDGTKMARGAFRCLLSNTPFTYAYIDGEANAGRMGSRLMAIVAEGPRGRIYLSPTAMMEASPRQAVPSWKSEAPSRGTWGSNAQGRIYGFRTFGDYFSPRQLVALTAFSDLVTSACEKVHENAKNAGMPEGDRCIEAGGTGARTYAESVTLFLAMAVSRWADLNNTICTWNATNNNVRAMFSRQAVPMTWDFAELSAFSPMAGFDSILDTYIELSNSLPASQPGSTQLADARRQEISAGRLVSTDPPYYDNIGYADLSDFFYVWLRRSLRSVFPNLLATLTTPKAEELVATPYRHGTREKAEQFFLDGMTLAMHRIAEQAHPAFPITIYYARKQSEAQDDSNITGWETFLGAAIRAGLSITGTWPMRTERQERSVSLGTNALASSIVLVCRRLALNSPTTSRRGFLRELNHALPEALDQMTRKSEGENSPVAPVDLSQAMIGPGMAVFSKYAAVLEADGKPMSVKTALSLINRFLAEDDFDRDTQFCLHWFEQHGWKEGKFGEADVLARAKGTAVEGVRQSGVLHSAHGIVRLLKWAEYRDEWDPASDPRLPVWEVLHQLIRVFKAEGEPGAGAVLTGVQDKAEATRQLAYRLYTLCERAGWAEDARAYNEIITSWSAIEAAAARVGEPQEQEVLFEV